MTTATATATGTRRTSTLRARPMAQSNSNGTQTGDKREVRRREHHEADIVIVGAGVLGCAAAVAFGRQGRSVVLLEKDLREPDRIVGELLQPGGVRALEELGLRGAHTPIQ
jgi:squalene monooxygenase